MSCIVLISLQTCRYFADTQDVAGTLEKMPHHRSREVYVLKGLRQHGYTNRGCVHALMNIPHNWRGFYLHTFTSLLWNHLASYRVREYGLKPVEGDLVLKKVDDPLRLIQAKYVNITTTPLGPTLPSPLLTNITVS